MGALCSGSSFAASSSDLIGPVIVIVPGATTTFSMNRRA